jgi:hypothetical protein
MKFKIQNSSYGFLLLFLLGTIIQLRAQDQKSTVDSSLLERINYLEQQMNYHKSGDDHFMVVGLANFGFSSNKTTNTLNGISTTSKKSNLGDIDQFEFSPMFLWRHEKKYLMEFEPTFSQNGLGVSWADISYFAAPNVIIRAGYLVLPFGTYSKKQAAGWINKFATDPIGIADMPTSDYGVEVEGGLPLGDMKMNYDLALSNGLQLGNDGTVTSGYLVDNNTNKTITGRLGLLPFSNSSLEIGVSGMFGKVGTEGTSFHNVNGNMYAFDFNYVKTYVPFLVNFKSQYNIEDISNADYTTADEWATNYTFKNHSTSSFTQCSIRPTGIQALHDFELAARYSTYNTPSNSTWGSDQSAFAIGLNYWLSWRSVIKFTYEKYNGNSTGSEVLNAFTGITKSNTLYLQFSIQL